MTRYLIFFSNTTARRSAAYQRTVDYVRQDLSKLRAAGHDAQLADAFDVAKEEHPPR
jgi:hypothetical protein